jgi:hypothetical protein
MKLERPRLVVVQLVDKNLAVRGVEWFACRVVSREPPLKHPRQAPARFCGHGNRREPASAESRFVAISPNLIPTSSGPWGGYEAPDCKASFGVPSGAVPVLAICQNQVSLTVGPLGCDVRSTLEEVRAWHNRGRLRDGRKNR